MKRQAFSVLVCSMAAILRAAAADEVCVSCSGPPAVYRCTVDEASKIDSYRHAKRVLQLACITELAREGGHGQCGVRRSGPEGCIGLDRKISLVTSLDAGLFVPGQHFGDLPVGYQVIAQARVLFADD